MKKNNNPCKHWYSYLTPEQEQFIITFEKMGLFRTKKFCFKMGKVTVRLGVADYKIRIRSGEYDKFIYATLHEAVNSFRELIYIAIDPPTPYNNPFK